MTTQVEDSIQYGGKQEDIRVDANDLAAIESLHQQFPGKSHDQIKKAIQDAGPIRRDIIWHLHRI